MEARGKHKEYIVSVMSLWELLAQSMVNNLE